MTRPLAEILRPKSFDDILGQDHLFGKDALFLKVIKENKPMTMIFYGPPGTGKTSVANIIAKNSKLNLYHLNGTSTTSEDIKKIIADSKALYNQDGILVYLDEIQYLNRKQQQTLLEFVESGEITLIAATTENPSFYIYPALLSRSLVFEFKPLLIKDIKKGLLKATTYLSLKIDGKALNLLASLAGGDMRKAYQYLSFLSQGLKNEDKTITVDIIKKTFASGNICYDRGEDKHYDHLSALMKSLRGSDPNAAVFYVAKMLEAGDLQAVCRRLLCSANEDVGLAYPLIIPIVKSAVDTALQLGLPEAKLPLANAAILIATAPKSNSTSQAIDLAYKDILQGKGINVPRSLQNSHFDSEEVVNKGQNYLYPHDYPSHYVVQQYLPDDIKEAVYYRFGDNKFEQNLAQYWAKIKKE